MKRLFSLGLVLGLVALAPLAGAQDKGRKAEMRAEVKAVMQNPEALQALMKEIARDERLRATMLQEITSAVKEDKAGMRELWRTVLRDPSARSVLSRMLAEAPDTTGPEVLVKFKPETPEEQIRAMAEQLGLQQVKVIKELNLRVFRVTSGKSVADVIKHCENEPFVVYAEPNQTYKTQKK